MAGKGRGRPSLGVRWAPVRGPNALNNAAPMAEAASMAIRRNSAESRSKPATSRRQPRSFRNGARTWAMWSFALAAARAQRRSRFTRATRQSRKAAVLAAQALDDLDAFLVELNRASGAAILPLFRGEHGLADKGPPGAFDPVTAADKAAEAVLRDLIGQHHPDHGVIGEEDGEDRPDAEFVWVLDPIDGTRAVVAGLPPGPQLVGLRHRGEPV